MTSNALGTRWAGHPLLTLPVPRHLDAWVKFTMWNKDSRAFEKLPAGQDVTMMDGSTPLHQQPLDANGTATFHIPVLTPDAPDLSFTIDLAGIPPSDFGHAALPPNWSTKGWRSAGGTSAGHYPDFAGNLIGASANPVEFQVGVAIFMLFEFDSTSEPGQKLRLLPNAPVKMRAKKTGATAVEIDAAVDSDGVVEFFSFDILPGASIAFSIPMRIHAVSGHFPYIGPIFVSHFTSAIPHTIEFDVPASVSTLAGNDLTTIGLPGGPAQAKSLQTFADGNQDICAAVTVMKNITELNGLIHHTAGADWTDFANCHVNLGFFKDSGISWPVGSINLSTTFTKIRHDQLHEAAHQLLWKWANYTTASIAGEYCLGLIQSLFTPAISSNARMNHALWWVINPENALLEGWATIFEFITGYSAVSLNVVPTEARLVLEWTRNSVVESGYYKIAKPISHWPGSTAQAIISPLELQADWGESCEGMFAGAMFNLFKKYVLQTPNLALPSLIPPTVDGDITQHPHLAWLTGTTSADQDARDRFVNVFVEPAKAIAGISNRTVVDFIDKLKIINANDWDAHFVPIMKHFHMGGPRMTSVSPKIVASAGNTTVTIQGTRIISGPATKVFFGGIPATGLSIGTNGLTCVAPSATAGAIVDLKLVTADGEHVDPLAITYI
jgi:hypothetical protein